MSETGDGIDDSVKGMKGAKGTIPGHPNLLIPTPEKAKVIGRLGGLKSAERNKARKTMAQALEEYLSARIQPSHPKYAEIKRMMRTLGLLGDGDEPDNQMLLLVGMMQRAQKDPAAAAFIRDTVGERPTENIAASIDAPPPVVIGIHDPAWIERERQRQERMVEDLRRTAVEIPAAETPETGDTQNGGVEAPESLRAKDDITPIPDARTQQAAYTAPSARFCEGGGSAAPKAPPPRPVPPKPPRPANPNVCLPSATPPV